MILRDYQLSAVDSLYSHWSEKPTSGAAIVIPTGGGKTPVMAAICLREMAAGRRGMVLAHRKELIEQTAGRIEKAAFELGEPFEPGIYSASLGRRDASGPVIVGQIQSVAEKAKAFGKLEYLLIDEAHLVPPAGEGRFRRFISDARAINPELRIAGLTATPYRTTSGKLCGPNELLQTIVHESGIVELMAAGYLCRLVTKQAVADVDTSGLHIRAGEYKSDEAAALMDTSERVRLACEEAVTLAAGRRSCLVFCCTVHHCHMVAAELRRLLTTGGMGSGDGDQVEVVTGETPKQSRADIISGFNGGHVRWLVNCDVLTTGFDSPRVDCVVLFRPTASEGLYYQMCGRGFRMAAAKENCLVLDFGGNIKRHGRLDLLEGDRRTAGIRTCPQCRTVAARGDVVCTMCGYEFPSRTPGGNGSERTLGHGVEAEDAPIVGGDPKKAKGEWLKVMGVTYHLNAGRGGKMDTLRAEYDCTAADGQYRKVKEWICFEHDGWARERAEKWWRERKIAPVPNSCRAAVEEIGEYGERGTINTPVAIRAEERPDGFDKITKVKYDAAGPPVTIAEAGPPVAEVAPVATGGSLVGSLVGTSAGTASGDRLRDWEDRLVASRAGLPEYGDYC